MKCENKRLFQGMKRKLVLAVFAVLLGNVMIPASFTSAQGEYGFPDHYPPGFDEQGRIDRIAVDEVVIDDILWKFSPDVKYHTKTTRNASRGWFKVGSQVGFIKDAGNRISALYLIQAAKP
jgi:hypothetical protein